MKRRNLGKLAMGVAFSAGLLGASFAQAQTPATTPLFAGKTPLRIIVGNVNSILKNGINLKGIIQLGNYLRTKGDKVDFVKLEKWLTRLRIQRIAQLEGSVLITFFDFEQDEIPFVRHVEPGAYKHTLRSLYYNITEHQDIQFEQNNAGFVHTTGGTMRKNLRRSMRFLQYAPIETMSNFMNNFFRSLSEIEE